MNRPLPVALAWLLLEVLHVVVLQLQGAELPARVASHFNLQGVADGWQSRDAFLLWASLGPIAIGLFVVAMIGLASRFPRHWNIPHKADWTSPENLPRARTFLLAWALWVALLVLLSTGLLLHGVVQVNLGESPARLPRLWTVLAVVVPAAAIGFMIVRLCRFFNRPPRC
jgi:uncharacterized membrane protein